MHQVFFNFDMWHLTTLLGLLFCTYVIVTRTPFRLPSKIVLLYFSLVSILSALYLPIGTLKVLELAKMFGASRIYLSILLVPLVALALTPRARPVFFTLFCSIAIWKSITGNSLFMGSTQDNLILVIFLPYFFYHYRWPSLITLLPLVVNAFGFFSEHGVGSIAAGVGKGALVVLAAYWILSLKRLSSSVVLVGFTAIFSFTYWDKIVLSSFNPMYRIKFWGEYLTYWSKQGKPNFGIGPGSFEWISATGNFENVLVWLHGDWAQILFEYGVIGLVLSVLFCIHILCSVRAHSYKFLVCVGMSMGMLVYSPMQFFLCQILLCYIVLENTGEVLNERETFFKFTRVS